MKKNSDSLREGRELASEAGMSQADFDKQWKMRPKKYYTVVRIIKETYQVVARNKEEAARLVQDPSNVQVIKEKITLQKQQP